MIALSGMLLAGLTAAPAVASPLQRAGAPVARRIQVGSEAWQLFQATNESRGRFGVAKLVLDRQMSQVALEHSLAMVRAGRLFHTADVETYLHGINWHAWGENVGYTPGGIGSMEDAFMASAPHRWNILNRSYTHVAIGVVTHDGYLWVTVFFYA
ncbi:MAG: CAP domain-containing protein [Actinomycetota bacterium]